MTEAEKKQTLDKVASLLDANERIRVHEAKSVKFYLGDQTRELQQGRERYLLIAVGEELETEKVAVRLLSSAILAGR